MLLPVLCLCDRHGGGGNQTLQTVLTHACIPILCVTYCRQIGNGVLIGAGACLLGNISVGKGTQIGAGSLVVTDLPERCVGRTRDEALAVFQGNLC